MHEKILFGVTRAVGYFEDCSTHVGNVGCLFTRVGESGPSVSRCLGNMLCWSVDSRFVGSDWK